MCVCETAVKANNITHLTQKLLLPSFWYFSSRKKKELFDMKLNSKQIQNMKCVQNGNLLNQKPIWHMKYI